MYTKFEELREGIMNLVSNHRHAIWSVSHAATLPAWITQSERKRYHRHAVSRSSNAQYISFHLASRTCRGPTFYLPGILHRSGDHQAR